RASMDLPVHGRRLRTALPAPTILPGLPYRCKGVSMLTIYHNPRCSKSRQTLALLRERGLEPVVVEYLQTPPSVDELDRILDLLGLEPRQIMRTKEAEYRELGLDAPELNRQQLLEAIHRHPRLLERPIVVYGERAALGRPPENVLAILS